VLGIELCSEFSSGSVMWHAIIISVVKLGFYLNTASS
jgi:hypothetical protein